MKHLVLASALGAVLILSGCATTKPHKVFAFDYEGNEARIISVSVVEATEHPYNILQVQGLGLRAVDHQQDQTIDVVLGGGLTVEDAQRIYDFGIEQAFKSGQVIEKNASRFAYEFRQQKTKYRVESFRPVGAEPFNVFTVEKPVRGLTRAVDNMADGTTDDPLMSSYDSDEAREIQEQYTRALDRGLKEGKIEMLDGTYHVRPN